MAIPNVTFLQSPFQNARDARFPLRAIVSHRIVGSLPSARQAFGLIPGDSGRSASSHFGIGYVGGVLTIDQYVPLDRMAWTNGDVRDPTWGLYQAGVNPNLTTVTIEHEDGGYAGRGVIAEPLWQASMELQALLVSGNAGAIRATGIRGATDAIVAQMAAISKDNNGFIDHHQIAGPNKPYCLRVWLDDPGFVYGAPTRRDRLLAAVRGEGGIDVPMRLRVHAVEWNVPPGTPFWTGGPGLGEQKAFTEAIVIDSIGREIAPDNSSGNWILARYAREFIWVNRQHVTPTMVGGDPAYDAAVFSVIEGGAGALQGVPMTEVATREAAAAKNAAGAVKTAATTAASKYGA